MIIVFKHVFSTFLFEKFSRRTSNYQKRIALFDPTHLMIMVDPVVIAVETLIDRGVL